MKSIEEMKEEIALIKELLALKEKLKEYEVQKIEYVPYIPYYPVYPTYPTDPIYYTPYKPYGWDKVTCITK